MMVQSHAGASSGTAASMARRLLRLFRVGLTCVPSSLDRLQWREVIGCCVRGRLAKGSRLRWIERALLTQHCPDDARVLGGQGHDGNGRAFRPGQVQHPRGPRIVTGLGAHVERPCRVD
jgi:hypothetical protein